MPLIVGIVLVLVLVLEATVLETSLMYSVRNQYRAALYKAVSAVYTSRLAVNTYSVNLSIAACQLLRGVRSLTSSRYITAAELLRMREHLATPSNRINPVSGGHR